MFTSALRAGRLAQRTSKSPHWAALSSRSQALLYSRRYCRFCRPRARRCGYRLPASLRSAAFS
eukprot:4215978-Pyramimonas_sp.AAC.1